MFQNTSDSKYQLVGIGDLVNPASCLGCGNGNCERGYINLAVSYDYEGQMYLCYYCTVEIAEIIGCMIPEEVAVLKHSLFETSERNTFLSEELDIANERLAAFDLVIGSASISALAAGTFSDSQTSEQSEVTSPLNGGGSTEAAPEQPESVEPITEPGLLDVSESERTNGYDDESDSTEPTVRIRL